MQKLDKLKLIIWYTLCMNKNALKLLEYLNDLESEKTAKEIAGVLSFSVRSIKNYVVQINEEFPNMIISSKNGYKVVNKIDISEIQSEKNKEIPSSSEERIKYILTLFLIDHCESVNLFDLSEEIFVSSSTIRLDIAKINRIYSIFNVSLVIKKDTVYMCAEEKDARRLFHHLLLNENTNYITNRTLEQIFVGYDIDLMESMILKSFRQAGLFINDFSKNDILVHLLILFEYQKQRIGNEKPIKLPLNEKEKEVIDLLCKNLNKFIEIDDYTKNEIAVIILPNINYFFSNNKDVLSHIDKKYINAVYEIVEKVEKLYALNLNNELFISQFSTHLKNLMQRCESNKPLLNPMKSVIKNQNPFIFEVGIYISLLIKEIFQVKITEDETCFIALHIGGEVERTKKQSPKKTCALFSPNYLSLKEWLYSTITEYFSSELNILTITSNINDLDNYNFDICISTISFDNTSEYILAPVTPYMELSQLKKTIYNAIDEVENKKIKSIIKNHYEEYFHEDLFFIEDRESPKTKEEWLSIMSEKMYHLEFVQESFLNNILKREDAGSTAFSKIAVPHSVDMDGLKTTICICVSKDGIRWDSQKTVNIVFLLSMNPLESNSFNELFEALISLFDEDVVDMLKSCTSYDQFKTLLYKIIS